MNGSLDYLLGQINGKLENHDKVFNELKDLCEKMETKLDIISGDMLVIKTKAKIWGAITGFLASVSVTVVGWFVFKG